MTRGEYVQRLAEINQTTSEEAFLELEAIENKKFAARSSTNFDNATMKLLSETTTYREYIVVKDFQGGYQVEAGALARIYNSGSFRQITNIDREWTGATGSGSYEWSEFYKSATHNGRSVTIQARGAVVIAVDSSISNSAEFGSELLGFGYTVSIAIGTKTYYRKVATWSQTFNLY